MTINQNIRELAKKCLAYNSHKIADMTDAAGCIWASMAQEFARTLLELHPRKHNWVPDFNRVIMSSPPQYVCTCNQCGDKTTIDIQDFGSDPGVCKVQ